MSLSANSPRPISFEKQQALPCAEGRILSVLRRGENLINKDSDKQEAGQHMDLAQL